jgi:hypothetical protein
MLQPSDDTVEHDSGSIDDGEFVIASGQSSPLLQTGITALDDIATLVLDRVELRWTATL